MSPTPWRSEPPCFRENLRTFSDLLQDIRLSNPEVFNGRFAAWHLDPQAGVAPPSPLLSPITMREGGDVTRAPHAYAFTTIDGPSAVAPFGIILSGIDNTGEIGGSHDTHAVCCYLYVPAHRTFDVRNLEYGLSGD
jgi:hypothetical protein